MPCTYSPCTSPLFCQFLLSFPEDRLQTNTKVTFSFLQVDYRLFHGELWEALPAAGLVTIVSGPDFLGNKRITTQHFIGAASKWIKKSDTEVVGHHQLRVAHVKYKDDEFTDVLARGHCHGGAVIHYRKVDGEWKFAGVVPRAGWSEFEFDKIFTEVLKCDEESKESEKVSDRAVATEHMYHQADCSEGL